MIEITDKKSSLTIDNSNGRVTPTLVKIDLKSIDDVRLEMAKIYREMRNQKIDAADGTKLIYVLSQIGKMIEIHDIEKRINLIEEKL
jgi:pyruvate/2-oxoglutarate dehydrogenase complex dihydrolipoamide acyltransferase (E2) component